MNLDFAKNNILSNFFFLYLIIDLYFLTPTVITKFNAIAELIMRIEILTKEAKAELKAHPLIVWIKISAQYN